MDLTWLPGDRRFVGTETEARKARKTFEKRSVPTVKADLIAFLNALEDERETAVAAAREEGRLEGLAQAGANAPEDAPPAPRDTQPTREPAPAGTTAGGVSTLVERILELSAAELPGVLSAAIGRLGEVAGPHGWAAFGKTVYGWTPGARSVEQGLGMLMLAAFDSFGMEGVPGARRSTASAQGDERQGG